MLRKNARDDRSVDSDGTPLASGSGINSVLGAGAAAGGGGRGFASHRKFKAGSRATPRVPNNTTNGGESFAHAGFVSTAEASSLSSVADVEDEYDDDHDRRPRTNHLWHTSTTNKLLIMILVLLTVLLVTTTSNSNENGSGPYDDPHTFIRQQQQQQSQQQLRQQYLPHNSNAATAPSILIHTPNSAVNTVPLPASANTALDSASTSSLEIAVPNVDDPPVTSNTAMPPQVEVPEPEPITPDIERINNEYEKVAIEEDLKAINDMYEEKKADRASNKNPPDETAGSLPQQQQQQQQVEEQVVVENIPGKPAPGETAPLLPEPELQQPPLLVPVVDDTLPRPDVVTPVVRSNTVAYVVPVFDCPDPTLASGRRFDDAFVDAAAVLKYAVHRASAHSNRGDSRYDYQMVALLHPRCADAERQQQLGTLGYRTMVRDVPVPVDTIQGEYLRTHITRSHTTEDRDLIRLHAYALTEYPVVVLLDVRSLPLRPLDALFDALSTTPSALEHVELAPSASNGTTTSPHNNTTVDAFFTRDYVSVSPQHRRYGLDPGLLVLRPSSDTFRELSGLLRIGDFRPRTGWAGQGYGDFRGAMTTKGLLAHYYDHVQPGTGFELNRCVYNNMADSPYVRFEGKNVCRHELHLLPHSNTTVANHNNNINNNTRLAATVEGTPSSLLPCEDCRNKRLDELYSVNLAACRDPWACFRHHEDEDDVRLCREMHQLWYRMRDELEHNWVEYGPWGGGKDYVPAQRDESVTHNQQNYGFCRADAEGKEAYVPMVPPSGGVVTSAPVVPTAVVEIPPVEDNVRRRTSLSSTNNNNNKRKLRK